MKTCLAFLLLIFAISPLAAAESLKRRAETNPLDCAVYLQTLDRNSLTDQSLWYALFDVGRYDDLLRVIEAEPDPYTRIGNLITYGTRLLDMRKDRLAEKFLLRAYAVLKTDDESSDQDLVRLVSSLAQINRNAEALEIYQKHDDDAIKGRLIASLVASYLKSGRKSQAVKWLKENNETILALANADDLAAIADAYQRLGLVNASFLVLARIEALAAAATDREEQRSIRLKTISLLLQLGQIDRALQVWQDHGDDANFYALMDHVALLANGGHYDAAAPFLSALEASGIGQVSDDLVKLYLRRGDDISAERSARFMSSESDSYHQQAALMNVADHFIASGKTAKAIELLDFAFNRAKEIVYEHRPGDSIGASAGSRKTTYLENISNRLIRLKLYDRAFSVTMAISADHDRARKSLAENFVSFAKLYASHRPKPEVYKLLTDAADMVKDEEYFLLKIKSESAEVYAVLGEKDRATDLLAGVITEAVETCCYEDDFLIMAGQVFDKYRLPVTPNLRVSLKAIIDSHHP